MFRMNSKKGGEFDDTSPGRKTKKSLSGLGLIGQSNSILQPKAKFGQPLIGTKKNTLGSLMFDDDDYLIPPDFGGGAQEFTGAGGFLNQMDQKPSQLSRNVSFKQPQQPVLNSNISDMIRNEYLNKNQKFGSIMVGGSNIFYNQDPGASFEYNNTAAEYNGFPQMRKLRSNSRNISMMSNTVPLSKLQAEQSGGGVADQTGKMQKKSSNISSFKPYQQNNEKKPTNQLSNSSPFNSHTGGTGPNAMALNFSLNNNNFKGFNNQNDSGGSGYLNPPTFNTEMGQKMFKQFSKGQSLSSGNDNQSKVQDVPPEQKIGGFGIQKDKFDTLQLPKKQNEQKAPPKKRQAKTDRKNSAQASDSKGEISDATSMAQDGQPKRRGRKREKHETYIEKAQKKIDKIKAQLKTAKASGMDVKERQKLRNMVSAQQSRIKKKEEVLTLNNMIKEKDEKMQVFIDQILVKRLFSHPELMESIVNDIQVNWPIDETSNSHTLPLQKTNSKKQKTDDIISKFKLAVGETFITDESELQRFKPNDVKESDGE